MRILWNNKIFDASFTALTVGFRYSYLDLLHDSLYLFFQASGPSDIISITWSDPTVINCVGIAGTNAKSVTVSILDQFGNTIEDVTVSDIDDTEMIYFSQAHQNVRFLRVEATTDEEFLRIGYLSAGDFDQYPPHLLSYTQGYTTTSVSEKHHGFTTGTEGVLLKTYEGVTLHDVDKNEIDMLVEMYKDKHNFRPFFIDMTEHNHEANRPLFCTLESGLTAPRYDRGTGRWHISGLHFEEAK